MNPIVKILHWLPRVLCILAILFVSLFALDSFEPGKPLPEQISHFLKHLIPTFILAFFLVAAWKWELPGGIIFVILGLGLAPFVYMMNYHMNNSVWMSLGVVLMINFPFILVGVFFILSYFVKKKNPS